MKNQLGTKINYDLKNSNSIPLIELAINNDLDIDKLQKLIELKNREEEKLSKEAYFKELSRMQSVFPVIHKNKKASIESQRTGSNFSYKYASLDSIIAQIRKYLEVYGFSYRFEQNTSNKEIEVICIITHESGHSERSAMKSFVDSGGAKAKNILQQLASTITYLRRYTLTGALGIATADDDIDANHLEQNKDILQGHRRIGREVEIDLGIEQEVLQIEQEPVDLLAKINECKSIEELQAIGKQIHYEVKDDAMRLEARNAYSAKLSELKD